MLSACLAPTEIEIDITTNVDCSSVSGTHIDVGQAGVDASVAQLETQQCSAGEIGTLVITPGGATDPTVSIEVAAAVGTTPDVCVPPYSIVDAGAGVGCIVARRAIHYTSHTPLRLPIALDSDCLNMPCLPDTTCEHGTCVPSMVDPGTCASDAGCQLGDAGAVADGGGPTPVQLAVGYTHACARMSDGTIRCWGDNTSGQLGNTTIVDSSPVAVQVETINDATSISAANQTTCALRRSGEVWCWGNDAYGAVDGIARDGGAPIIPTPTGPTVTGAIAVSVGSTFTCALLSTNGPVTTDCWGERPPNTNMGPSAVIAINGVLTDATKLACGYSACVETDGMSEGFLGEDITDQLHLPDNTGMIVSSTTSFLPVPVTGIAMGGGFGCAFGGTSGGVTCWGDNADGELGQYTPGGPALSVAVTQLSNVTAVTASDQHACALSGGIVSCWGDNTYGQLNHRSRFGITKGLEEYGADHGELGCRDSTPRRPRECEDTPNAAQRATAIAS